jgi:hypothetical protein
MKYLRYLFFFLFFILDEQNKKIKKMMKMMTQQPPMVLFRLNKQLKMPKKNRHFHKTSRLKMRLFDFKINSVLSENLL